ncbi:glycosyltransferase family 2 protein [Caballeronia insecticola]|uniref:Glycosyltransferase n=1 Tax=Caballeronia insecticola TaxID=758793 RepID=R4WI62_9BURK|nr:glycosyltransferase family 2 protein [Caballeronia insecticola]BAN23944.1 glycosyltransferase [Caballeronia insecticola]
MFDRTAPRVVPFETIFDTRNRREAAIDGVTVAVSLYNYDEFIIECLESIAKQRHERLELIVVDDHSPDTTALELADEWLKENHTRFDRALLVRHVDNQGLAEARNTAFHYSRTDPVFVIDADNQIYPRAISRLFEFIEFREFDAAFTQLEFFGNERRLGYADFWDKERFRRGNYVDAMALISRRSWEQVGGYSHIEGGWEDFDFWCKFIDAGMKAAYVPEVLSRYRVHGTSMLRTDTAASTARLKVELTMRHPWLRL